MRGKLIAAVVVAWALVTWGGRIGLLTGAEAADPVTWLRVGGSLATAGLGAYGVVAGRRWLVWIYAAWTLAVWGTSLVSVWTADHSAAFLAVHTLLAVVSVGIAVLAVMVRRDGASPTPEPPGSGAPR